MIKLFMAFSLFYFVGCAQADVLDFQRAKHASEITKIEKKQLDRHYVGFTRQAFIEDFGSPETSIVDAYPYSLDPDCYSADCPEGTADELLTYTFLKRDSSGRHYYSVYAYIKNGVVVRIR